MSHNSNGEWLTVKQASHMTGRSIDAIRMLLHRKKLSNVKKVNGGNGGAHRAQWLIHKDTVSQLCNSHMTDEQPDVIHDNTITEGSELSHNALHNIDVIPLHYHDQKQREWLTERDQLQTGLMMYRWKYEELDRQVKMLPAPVEVLPSMVQDRDARIRALEEELAEKSLPWWKRMFRR